MNDEWLKKLTEAFEKKAVEWDKGIRWSWFEFPDGKRVFTKVQINKAKNYATYLN